VKKLLLIFLISFLTVCSFGLNFSCENVPPGYTKIDEGSFTFVAPSDWVLGSPSVGDIIFNDGGGSTVERIGFIPGRSGTQFGTFSYWGSEEWNITNNNSSKFRSYEDNYVQLSKTKKMLNSRLVYITEYEYETKNNKWRGVQVITEGRAKYSVCQLYVECSVQSFTNWEETFRTVINSFKVD
jgi:hypothetical protein